MGEAHKFLLELEPMSRLDDAGRSTLAKSFREKLLGARQPLYRAGDAPPGLWLIVNGFVKLTRSSPSGKELLMSLAGPGDMVGPCCDPLGASPAACTAVTQSAARLLHMPFPTWRTLTQTAPSVAQPVLAVMLASRRGCTDLATQLAFLSVEARVAALLHSLARWSQSGPGPLEIPRILTQAEMASAVGTVREVVTRCLARLEEQGLIERHGRRLLVPDPAALARLAA